MPINLTTGLPGSGKTLSTLVRVKALSERENRPVYYYGIKDLQLSWILLDDPKQWFALPQGSIIVIDECQDFFPVHETKLAGEPYVLELAKHRHRGYDLFFISQHPMNIHAYVRRLIDNHQHLIRAFGMKYSNIHEWQRVIDYPEKTKKDSQVTMFNFPKDAFTYYKSAEVHTISRKLPKRLFWILVIPFILALLGWKAWSVLNPEHQREQILGHKDNLNSSRVANASSSSENKVDWFQAQVPRIQEFPQSAPKYDEISKPTEVPLPAACVSMGKRCSCFTQQATIFKTTDAICRQIVKEGFFQDFYNKERETKIAKNDKITDNKDNNQNIQSPASNMGGIGGQISPPMAFADSLPTKIVNTRPTPYLLK